MRAISALKYAAPLLGLPFLFAAVRTADSVGTVAIRSQGYFYVAGQYDNPANPTYMSGQMYVEYQIPNTPPKYPIILVHGGSHTGAGWQSTPDGRPGWADFFLQHGWPVYVVDQPGRGRSTYSAAPTARAPRWCISSGTTRMCAPPFSPE